MTPSFFQILQGICIPLFSVENVLQHILELRVSLVLSIIANVTASMLSRALYFQHKCMQQRADLSSGFCKLLTNAFSGFNTLEFLLGFFFEFMLRQAVSIFHPAEDSYMFFLGFFISLISSFSAKLFLIWQKLRAQNASFRSIFTTAVFDFELTEFIFSNFIERYISLLFPFAILYAFEFSPITCIL